jgi:hypothetical protein
MRRKAGERLDKQARALRAERRDHKGRSNQYGAVGQAESYTPVFLASLCRAMCSRRALTRPLTRECPECDLSARRVPDDP